MKKAKTRRLFEFLLDLVYPTRCPACGKVIGYDERFCADCESRLEYVEPVPWQAMFPAEIGGEQPAFDCAEALFRYEGTARKSVLSLKYRGNRSIAKYAADRLPEKLASDGIEHIDLITSVPMHFLKRLARGYDQAEIFASELSRETGVPRGKRLLGHTRRRRSQHELSAAERRTAAESTYFIRSREDKPLAGKVVLLCDDIFTTGSTANKCAKLLKELGAEKVVVAVICLTAPNRKKENE